MAIVCLHVNKHRTYKEVVPERMVPSAPRMQTRRLCIQDNRAFDNFHAAMKWEQKWCCLTTNNTHKLAGHQHIFYIQPTLLSSKPQLPWRIPEYTLPDFCSPLHDLYLQEQDEPEAFKSVFRSRNHPCNYFQPGVAPTLPEFWTRNVSQLTLPVPHGEGWKPFAVPGDQAQWLNATIAHDGRGVVPLLV
jgi:hypothetical protein